MAGAPKWPLFDLFFGGSIEQEPKLGPKTPPKSPPKGQGSLSKTDNLPKSTKRIRHDRSLSKKSGEKPWFFWGGLEFRSPKMTTFVTFWTSPLRKNRRFLDLLFDDQINCLSEVLIKSVFSNTNRPFSPLFSRSPSFSSRFDHFFQKFPENSKMWPKKRKSGNKFLESRTKILENPNLLTFYKNRFFKML